MDNLTHDAIADLLNNHQHLGPAVTVYAPTHRSATPPNMTEDQIRFKNLVHKSAEILKARDDGKELAAALCDRLETLLADRNFWETQTEGLLMCAYPGLLQMYHLPVDTEEYVAVDVRFHLAPIFALLNDEQLYYVLTVGQHQPALFQGDAYDLRPTKLQLPESVEAGLNLDEPNAKTEQQRSTGGDTGGFNGRGGAKNPLEEERQRFWRMLDQKVNEFADTKLPLILAGTASELAEYRANSKYPLLLEAHIEGSFGGAKPHDLFTVAGNIIRAQITNKKHAEALEEYQRLSGANPERVASDLAAIKDAAEQGRIDKLLLGILRHTADTVRDNQEPVPVISFPGTDEQNAALNLIAQQVFTTSGQVVGLEQGTLPNDASMLARLRY